MDIQGMKESTTILKYAMSCDASTVCAIKQS